MILTIYNHICIYYIVLNFPNNMKHRNWSKSTYVALGGDKSRKLVKTRSKPERKQSFLQTKKNAAKNAEGEGEKFKKLTEIAETRILFKGT